MKSHQTSVGKFFLGLVFCLTGGCSSSQHTGGSGAKEDLTKEVSLKADRSQLAELRKEIPEAVQQENDELAYLLKLMGDTKDQPYVVREKWNTEVRKRRTVFDKWARDSRQKFNDEDLKKRNAFLKDQESTRTGFTKEKHSSQERSDFFGELDTKRRTYFAAERDRREEFESDVRGKRKDFEDYMRERQGAFDQEYRDYVKRFEEARKEKERLKKEADEAKRAGASASSAPATSARSSPPAEVDPDMLEFQNPPKTRPIQLNSGPNSEGQ